MRNAILAVIASVFALSTASYRAPVAAADCNRDCLRGIVTTYLDAMVAHDSNALPVSASFRFTEDTVPMKLGEGLWKSITKLTPYRRDIFDVRQGVAVTWDVVEEGGSPVLHAARLKIADRRVTELETMVVRSRADGSGIMEVDSLKRVREEMIMIPDRAQLNTRAEMIKIAERYPAGLRAGSFVAVDAQFAPSAYRLENGRLMAGPGCTFAPGCEEIKTQQIRSYPTTTFRVAAVDEELGVVALRQNFGPRPNNAALDLHTWHAFKIYGGRIQAVEAFMKVLPTGTPSGWD